MNTYGEETEEYKAAKMNWGERRNELNKQIDLSCSFAELRRNLDVFEEMKEWVAWGEIERKEKVGNQLPAIQEEGENGMGWSFWKLGKMVGSESKLGAT